MTLLQLLDQRVCAALTAAGASQAQALIQPASRPEFGDYQANGVMAAAKQLKMAPRALAQQVVDTLDLAGIASKIDIAGPGFINITLDNAFLAQQLQQAAQDSLFAARLPALPPIVSLVLLVEVVGLRKRYRG